MDEPRRINVLTKGKIGVMFFYTIVFLSCSSNPKLVAIDENKIEKISIVPAFKKDVLQVYYKKEISGEIYVDYQPTKEERYTLQNYLIYYSTDNPDTIGDIIKDLKIETPSIFSVFGASYGVPIFRIKIQYKAKKNSALILFPPQELKKLFIRIGTGLSI